MRDACRGLAVASSLVLLVGTHVACASPASTRVEIEIHHSRFEPSEVTVPHGVPITFVLVNRDPIEHEWLIGDADFHRRHRTGTEAHHGARPDEVGLLALTSEQTTIVFSQPGRLAFICHLPGHEAYGMVGSVTVI